MRVQDLLICDYYKDTLCFFTMDISSTLSKADFARAIRVSVTLVEFEKSDMVWINNLVKGNVIELPMWIDANKAEEFCNWMQRQIDNNSEKKEFSYRNPQTEFFNNYKTKNF